MVKKKAKTRKTAAHPWWPDTKKELEKVMKNARGMIEKGEKYVRDVSDKSVNNTKILALNLEREKLCYGLGKVVASTPQTKWRTARKVKSALSKISKLDKEIKRLK